MDLLAGHDTLEFLRAAGTGGDRLGLHLLQHEIDRLHRARGLLGKDGAEVDDLALIAGDRLLAAVPDRHPGGNQRDADEDDPDEAEAMARSRPAPRRGR